MKKIERIKPLKYSILLDTDSYKYSHYKFYPEKTSKMMSYLESRGGEFKECTLFGLQYLLHKYLTKKITKKKVLKAQLFATQHGVPFNYDGWMYIVNKYNGKLPVTIRAIKEGTVVPTSNALLTIECEDPNCFWICSWLETMLLRLWYPSTVAINSRECKKIIKKYLDKSSDTPESIVFKLHDFGSRGVATYEQSLIGGAAHLLSFMGSDTVGGVALANHYYHNKMSGFSIQATEHSIVSMYGREKEFDFYKSYIEKSLVNYEVPEGMPKLASCVSDTYNIFEACKFWARKDIREMLKNCNGTLVIRPDSGDPVETLSKIFSILEEELGDAVTLNNKGYKMLPPELRIIQGDGINREMIDKILFHLVLEKRWSAENITFGSGGGLLQKFDRDTCKWAFKCCSALVDNVQVNVVKDPITDTGKRSKAGRLDLILENGEYKTVAVDEFYSENSQMNIVFKNGDIYFDTTLDECRDRMKL